MSVTATPDGVLLVDKAAGMTSHDVVALVRRRLQIKKVGHCGTLDPIATGLLLLTLGRGTKIQDLLMSEDKEYAGTLTLGDHDLKFGANYSDNDIYNYYGANSYGTYTFYGLDNFAAGRWSTSCVAR